MIIDWRVIKHFKREEFSDPRMMDHTLVYELDRFREYLGKPIQITASYAKDGHSQNSQHYLGRAVDIKCPDLKPIEFFLQALRFDFSGYGLYTWGIHVDTRKIMVLNPKAMWCQIDGKYQNITLETLKNFI